MATVKVFQRDENNRPLVFEVDGDLRKATDWDEDGAVTTYDRVESKNVQLTPNMPQKTRTDKYTGKTETVDRDQLRPAPSLWDETKGAVKEFSHQVKRNPAKTAAGIATPALLPSGTAVPVMGMAAAADEIWQNQVLGENQPLGQQLLDVGSEMVLSKVMGPELYGLKAAPPLRAPETVAQGVKQSFQGVNTPAPVLKMPDRSVNVTRPGEGYKEAVVRGSQRAGIETTPMQQGSKAGQMLETAIDANPASQFVNQGRVEAQRDAAAASRNRIFADTEDVAKTGRKVKETLKNAEAVAKRDYEGAFSLVNDDALLDPRVNLQAAREVQRTMGNIRQTMNLRSELVEHGLVPLDRSTLSILERVQKLTEIGSNYDPVLGGKAPVMDYQGLNSVRQTIGKLMEKYEGEKGMSQDLRVLGELYGAIEDAQTKFLTPEGAQQWQTAKGSFAQFDADRKMLRPILTDQTKDANVVGSLVKDGGPESLQAVLRYAQRTGDKEIVDQVRSAYLQDLVDNTTTLKQFDKSLAKLKDVQKQYFNDEMTQRARDLVALNQAIETLATQQDAASRQQVALFLGGLGSIGAGSALGTAAGGGAIATGLAGAGGLAVYLGSGVVTRPVYDFLISNARNVTDEGVKDALGRMIKAYEANQLPNVLGQTAPSLQGYSQEQR